MKSIGVMSSWNDKQEKKLAKKMIIYPQANFKNNFVKN